MYLCENSDLGSRFPPFVVINTSLRLPPQFKSIFANSDYGQTVIDKVR